MQRRLRGVWLGKRRYEPTLALQRRLHTLRRENVLSDTVLLVEHDPVVTVGRRGQAEHVLVSEDTLSRRRIDLVETDRGGDVTLHAPGQLVCYPIVDLSPELRDVRGYVERLTETMRRLALDWGVSAGSISGLTGLWVDRAQVSAWPGEQEVQDLAKLGAIGVRLSRWVTMHGFALNLTTDLELFSLIVPCGIRQHGVTSIQALTRHAPAVATSAPRALQLLADVLHAEVHGCVDHSSDPIDGLFAQGA